MKKRMFVYFLVMTICLFHLFVPDVVFAQAVQVFQEYEETFKHPDVHAFFPGVLEAFKDSENQLFLNSTIMNRFVERPRYLREFAPEADDAILSLLLLDDQFRALFRDRQFHAMVRNTTQIDRLIDLIQKTTPYPPEGRACSVPPPPPPPRATTLSIVSGFGQEDNPGAVLSRPFVVEVRDQYGEAFPGSTVSFRITKGGGRVSPTTARTDNLGQASTTLTLGGTAGAHWVEARVSGITRTQTFTATATAPDVPPPPPPLSLPPMYWIEGNRIYHRPTGGGETSSWTPQDGTLTGGLAVDTVGEKVYWTEKKSDEIGRVRRANLDGSKVQTVKDIDAVPYDITVGTDGNNERWVYWTNSRKKVQRINVNEDIKVNRWVFQGDFMKLPTPPKHIAFDQGKRRLYWTEKKRIRWVAADGKRQRPTIVNGLGELGGIAVADGTVYWTEQTNGFGKVRSMNGNSSGDKKLLAVTESIPVGIAVDADGERVYWKTADGEIQSVPLTGAIQMVDTSKVGGTESSADAIALGGKVGMSSSSVASAPSVSSGDSGDSVENTLLANYPNPFNPETWIPYQLAASANVSVSIYSVNGHLVRRLELGHQSAGVYRSRSRAAYWDGRNEFGERVASGLYFYTLTAGDFTATRKMLIRK